MRKPDNPPKKRKEHAGPVTTHRNLRVALKLFVLLLGSFFALYPFLIILGASFDPTNSISGQSLIPAHVSLENYRKLILSDYTPVFRWLGNSLLVSGLSAAITLSMTTLAAYAFSRFRFSGRRAGLMWTMIIQVFPTVAAIVAIYALLRQIGNIIPILGLNSLGGLILIYTGGALGANAFLMKGYFDTIPREIDEAAHMDGAGHVQTFLQIILPMIRPVLAVIAIISFIGTFNDYLLPRVLLTDKNVFTLAVGMTIFLNNQFSVNWGVFSAGALIGAIPIIIIFLALQTQIVSGLTRGAVKG
jgi:arabinogalactan oligomer/maltooligosaccharide transport system permease protein